MTCTHGKEHGLTCKNEAVRPGGYCADHGCCLCGGVMLADTEDWKVHLCHECLYELIDDVHYGPAHEVANKLVDAAFEAGRRSVIGYCEPDEVAEGK